MDAEWTGFRGPSARAPIINAEAPERMASIRGAAKTLYPQVFEILRLRLSWGPGWSTGALEELGRVGVGAWASTCWSFPRPPPFKAVGPTCGARNLEAPCAPCRTKGSKHTQDSGFGLCGHGIQPDGEFKRLTFEKPGSMPTWRVPLFSPGWAVQVPPGDEFPAIAE